METERLYQASVYPRQSELYDGLLIGAKALGRIPNTLIILLTTENSNVPETILEEDLAPQLN